MRRVLTGLAVIGLWAGLGFAAQADGQPDRHTLAAAQARLLTAVLREPKNFDLTFEYVRVSSALGDYEGAIGALERVLAFAPNLARADFELGTLYFRLGSYDNAIHYFKAAAAGAGP